MPLPLPFVAVGCAVAGLRIRPRLLGAGIAAITGLTIGVGEIAFLTFVVLELA